MVVVTLVLLIRNIRLRLRLLLVRLFRLLRRFVRMWIRLVVSVRRFLFFVYLLRLLRRLCLRRMDRLLVSIILLLIRRLRVLVLFRRALFLV